MNMNNVQGISYPLMVRIRQEYEQLVGSGISISMASLLSSSDLDIDTYSNDFTAHSFVSTLSKTAKKFCESYGIWLPGSEHYITCAMFLFPHAPLFRIIPILKNNAIDFYLNDVMGREVYPHLPLEKKIRYNDIRIRMSSHCGWNEMKDDAEPVELANRETLKEMQYISPSEWFTDFVKLYCHHIDMAHKDCNSYSTNQVVGLEEYMYQRSHISGMPHTVKLIEFSTGSFIHPNELASLRILDEVERLNWVVSLVGCLMNDLFSFEKEVIDKNTDSNLIAVLMSNDTHLSLGDALHKSGAIVCDLLEEYLSITNRIELIISKDLDESYLAIKGKLGEYLSGIKRCVQACWKWQVSTKRYKRPKSIWKETQLNKVLIS
jgi:hypothetical protein